MSLDPKRFFVRGMSRSGGTLMVTLLDAHPEISMAYEVYEHLLMPDSKFGLLDMPGLVEQVQTVASQSTRNRRFQFWRRSKGGGVSPQLKTFMSRARRGGVDERELCNIVESYAAAGGGIDTIEDRLKLIEKIVHCKMDSESKSRWGAKINGSYAETAALWPDSCFFFMLRDGRDIVSSRRHTGEFKKSIEEIAAAYVQEILLFRAFADRPDVNAHIVHYESLAQDPGGVLRKIFGDAGLTWSDDVLHHESSDLTLFRDPTGHLSASQVNKPINTGSIGRWKKELSVSEVDRFESVAGDELERYGYDRHVSCE